MRSSFHGQSPSYCAHLRKKKKKKKGAVVYPTCEMQSVKERARSARCLCCLTNLRQARRWIKWMNWLRVNDRGGFRFGFRGPRRSTSVKIVAMSRRLSATLGSAFRLPSLDVVCATGPSDAAPGPAVMALAAVAAFKGLLATVRAASGGGAVADGK